MSLSEEPDLWRRLQEFLKANATLWNGDRDPERATIDEAQAFQRKLFDAGLAGPSWEREFGGLELSAEQQAEYAAEVSEFLLPVAALTIGLSVCGPAVVQFGTPAQRRRHGRATLRGDEVWCQLWSEPDAGSDLASLRTKATRNPSGGWTISGSKVWTSGAHHADFGLLLARTESDQPRHRGLSMFVLDMRSPGITVRPLRQMNGLAEFNEVTLDDVQIPDDGLLGERAGGWRIVTWMMAQERTSVGMQMRYPLNIEWADLRRMVRQAGRDSDSFLRARMAALHASERAAQLLNLRVRQEALAGTGSIVLGSAAKVAETAVLRETAELAYEVAGASAWPPEDEMRALAAGAVLQSPGHSIGGGTDEIQLNALADRILGLPR